MKITLQTKAKLVLKEKQPIPWRWLTGDMSCEFDKARNRMKLNRGDIMAILQGAGQAECVLKDIKDVILEEDFEEEEKDEDGRVTMPAHKTFRVALVLKSGNHIPLSLHYGAERSKKSQLVQQISTFLFHTDYKRTIRRIKPKEDDLEEDLPDYLNHD